MIKYKLDHTDLCILKLLQKEGNLSNNQIAKKLNMSQSAIARRVVRLTDHRFIEGFTVILNKKLFEPKLTVLAQVVLNDHSGENTLKFKRRIVKYREILECYQTTGTCDFHLKIAIQDLRSYNQFLLEKLSSCGNVRSVQSFFVISVSKNNSAVPLHLEDI